jgi:hypothetical protein
MTKNIILFDRKKLKNPNGIFLGLPGGGKSFLTKQEISRLFRHDCGLKSAQKPINTSQSWC